jgi:hypothetical protein
METSVDDKMSHSADKVLDSLGVTDTEMREHVKAMAEGARTPDNMERVHRVLHATEKFESTESFKNFIQKPEVIMSSFLMLTHMIETFPLLNLAEHEFTDWTKSFTALVVVLWEDQELVEPTRVATYPIPGATV